MQSTIRSTGLLALFGIVVSILVGIIAVPHIAVAQETNVEPNSGTPGTTFYFFAEGFEDSERVGYWVNAPDETVYTDEDSIFTVASDEGRIDWEWKSPEDAMAGTWVMVAQGINGGHEAVISFEITSTSAPVEGATPTPAPAEEPAPAQPPDVAPQENMSPPEAPAGSRFEFYSLGFDDGERVGYWLNAPDGGIVGDDEDYFVIANDEGRAAWEWESPEDAMSGTWTMVAYGEESEYQVVFLFQIYPLDITPDMTPTEEPMPVEQPSPQAIPSAGPVDTSVDANMSPVEGSAGTTFEFYSYGFDSGERVGFWANAPDDTVESNDETYFVYANDEGRASWSWSAPEDAMPGTWTLVAGGAESGYEQIFIISITN